MCGVELQFALYREIYKLVSGYFSDAYLEIGEFEKLDLRKKTFEGPFWSPLDLLKKYQREIISHWQMCSFTFQFRSLNSTSLFIGILMTTSFLYPWLWDRPWLVPQIPHFLCCLWIVLSMKRKGQQVAGTCPHPGGMQWAALKCICLILDFHISVLTSFFFCWESRREGVII